jgi:enterochelin esterase family protein
MYLDMNTEKAVVKGNDFTRTIWFSPGPKDTAHPLCIFLDGEHYREGIDAPSTLKKLIADGLIPQMSVAFVSHNGTQSRHEDYTCNDRFARYVSEDIFRWAKNQVPTIRDSGNLICGVSLSGLASAHIALLSPHLFSMALCQSGSFWWERKQFANIARERPLIGSRFWLSVGNKETQESATHQPTGMRQEFSQVEGVQMAVEALKASGAEVKHHIFNGGHSYEPWKAELRDALRWLVESRV